MVNRVAQQAWYDKNSVDLGAEKSRVVKAHLEDITMAIMASVKVAFKGRQVEREHI